MKLLFVSLLLIVAGNSFAQTSYVAPTRILSKNGHQLGLSGDIFNSSTRFDREGKEYKFENGESFSRLQGDVFGHYGLTRNLQIGGGLRYRQNSSKVVNLLTGVEESETSTGIESTYFNLMFAFKPIDRFQYTMEALFRFRPYSNDETVGTTLGNLALGDEGNEYSAGLGLTYSSKTGNFISGRVGYRSPGQEISNELYWQVEGALNWKYLALVAGVDGITSLKNDPYGSDNLNRPNFNTGSSLLYNKENRELIAPYAGINLALGKAWRVELKGAQVISGRSTDLGTSFGASLIRRVEDKTQDRPDKVFKDYDFEGTITKISPKKGYVVIDKGLADDVRKGMKIDFFEFDYVGGNILLARGMVVQSKAESSVVKITQLYNTKKELKEGIIARGSFR
jgi:hypothetical protein